MNFMLLNLFSVRKHGPSCLRLYSASSTKITTHYTIYPREADHRWNGIVFRLIFDFN